VREATPALKTFCPPNASQTQSFTTKAAPMSSTDQGGGKRRGGIFHVLTQIKAQAVIGAFIVLPT
jgi:hypothetical protein